MALTRTLVSSTNFETELTSYVSDAFTSVSGATYRVVWFAQHAGGSTAPSPSWSNNQSLTRRDIASAVHGAVEYACGIYEQEFKVVTGASTTFTMAGGAPAWGNGYVRIYRLEGEDLTDSHGGSASGQAGGTNGAFAQTLSATPVAADISVSYLFGTLDSGNGSVDQASGYTEEFDANRTAWNIRAGATRTGSTSTTAGWADVSNNSTPATWFHAPLSLSVIIKAASGGGSSVTGTGALTAPAATASGVASTNGAKTGTGALTNPLPTVAGTAVRGLKDLPGAIALTGPVATLSGSGTVTQIDTSHTGTGALVSPKPTVAGAAVRGVRGTGALTSPKPTVAGSQGPRAITGTGALVLTLPLAAGAGVRHITGTGALACPKGIVVGIGPGAGGGLDILPRGLAHGQGHKRAIRFAHGRRAQWRA